MSLILDGTNGVSDIDGTAATPAIRGTDTNTGIFFPAADTIAFSEDGTEVARFDSSGRLGIGTTSPQEKLSLEGSGSQYMRVKTTTTNADIYFGITSSSLGYVGTGGSDPLTFLTGGSERMRINSSGQLLVNITSGVGRIRMKQAADSYTEGFIIENFGNTNAWYQQIGSDNNLYFGYNTTSKGYFANTTGAYTTVSDLNLKKNVEDINYGLSSVLNLRPVSYQMKDQDDTASKTLGFIAQEALNVVPESVSQMANELYGMDKQALIPVLVKAIQELKATVDAQAARIAALEAAV